MNGTLHLPDKKPSRTTLWRRKKAAHETGNGHDETVETGQETAAETVSEPETANYNPYAGLEPYIAQAQQAGVSVAQFFQLFEQLDHLLRVDFVQGVENLADLYKHPKDELGQVLTVRHRQFDRQALVEALAPPPSPIQAPEPPAPLPDSPAPISWAPQPVPAAVQFAPQVPPPTQWQPAPPPRHELQAELAELRQVLAAQEQEIVAMKNRSRADESRYRALLKSQAAAKHIVSSSPREPTNPPRRDEAGPSEPWLTTVEKAYAKQQGN